MYTAPALVVLAGRLGPLLAATRRPRVPVLVGELIGGILLGRTRRWDGAPATMVHLVAAFIAGEQQRLASGLLASAQLGLPAAAAAIGLPRARSAHRSRPLSWRVDC